MKKNIIFLMLLIILTANAMFFFSGCSELPEHELPKHELPKEFQDEHFYYAYKDTGVSVSGFVGFQAPENLIIPSEKNGVTVTEIGVSAFQNRSEISIVEIPEGVISISHYAFYNCTGLTKITIPSTVKSIETRAFADCGSLRTVIFSGGTSQLENIGFGVFANCTSLLAFPLPTNITWFGDNAFFNCTSMTGTVNIPASVTYLGSGAYAGCFGITAATVDILNPKYISQNGVVYSKKDNSLGALLIYYPAGKTDAYFTVPADVGGIHGYAISNNLYLRNIDLNNISSIRNFGLTGCKNLSVITGYHVSFVEGKALEGTAWLNNNTNSYVSLGKVLVAYKGNESIVNLNSYTSIADYAFYGNEYIIEVNIGNDMVSLGSYAFYNCPSLTTVKIFKLYNIIFVRENTFGFNAKNFMIYVPITLLPEYYSNEMWNQFLNKL